MKRVRWVVGIVIFGLVVSGVTAFPLLHELRILEGMCDQDSELGKWIHRVTIGLEDTYAAYPFIGYGTDWLAFGHLVIAMFFVLPWRDPVRYEGVLWVGVWASLLVIPLALICGPIRGIPFGWRLIDCSFGLLCLIPLGLALKWIGGMRELTR
ncbi:hypothetical protein [Haloferula sp.]|uniref:hypothetical protein n=1 Tax=Haloferula sp. TaxID=2497595 RepID=UPI00329F700C